MSNSTFIRQFCNRIRKLKRAKLPAKQRAKLRKHRKALRALLSKSTSMETRRKLLGQRGGFVGAILSALPVITSLIGAATSMMGKR